MNEDQKKAAVTVLDRMVACGWIKAMARDVSGGVNFVPTESGFRIIKSLRQLFSSEPQFTPLELSAFVLLIKQLDQIR
jgi:hypothetical protein